MIKKLLCVFSTCLLMLVAVPAAAYSEEGPILREIEFKGAEIIDAMRIISELSDVNIVVTPEARDNNVTIFLRNISVKQVIETICRVNNLWYRKEANTNTYRIMTNDEYSKDLIIHRDEATQVFTLNNLNVSLAADAIANLYGARVKRSSSGEQFSAGQSISESSGGAESSSSSNTATSGGGNGGQSGGTDRLQGELSIDQLSVLETSGASGNLIAAEQVQRVFNQQEAIYVTVASEHNLVIVRTGDNKALLEIAKLIKQLDRPVPQVLLEMKILDVIVDDDFSSVFNFEVMSGSLQGDSNKPILLGNNPLPNNGSYIFEYMNSYLKANIELLERNNRANVLSTPIILASNNRPSKLFVGEQQLIVKGYVATESKETTTDGVVTVTSGNIVPTTSIEEVGNTIEITPFINMKDGTVTLNLSQQSSSVRAGGAKISIVTSRGEVKVLAVDTINSAILEGTIIVKNNNTIAVGGLIRETQSDDERSVPGLSNLPGLGKFFTSKVKKSQRTELILLITPRVLNLPEDGEFNKAQFEKKGMQLSVEQISIQCASLCQ